MRASGPAPRNPGKLVASPTKTGRAPRSRGGVSPLVLLLRPHQGERVRSQPDRRSGAAWGCCKGGEGLHGARRVGHADLQTAVPITLFGCSAQGPPKTRCVRGERSSIREAKSCPSWFIWAMSHRISPSSGSRRFASRILRALARLPRRPLNTGSGVRSCTDRRRGVAGEEGALARAALPLRVFARVAPCSGKVGNKSGKAA